MYTPHHHRYPGGYIGGGIPLIRGPRVEPLAAKNKVAKKFIGNAFFAFLAATIVVTDDNHLFTVVHQ